MLQGVHVTLEELGASGLGLPAAPTNQAPDARDDIFSTSEALDLTGNVLEDNGTGVDADLDGDPLVVSAVNGQAALVGTQTALASGATLTLNADGTFSYDPNSAFDGLAAGETATDSFTYQISDGRGGTDTATATMTVQGVGTPVTGLVAGPEFLVNQYTASEQTYPRTAAALRTSLMAASWSPG